MNTSQHLKENVISQFPIAANPMLHYEDKLYFLGSCFSDEMSSRFKKLWISTQSNPFGSIYSPLAIANSLSQIESGNPDEFYEFGSQIHAMQFDSSWVSENREELLTKSKQQLYLSKTEIANSKQIWITLGTAWVYQLKDTGQWVGNCHKIPQNNFQKRCLTHAEIHQSLEEIVSSLQKINPEISIGFTVSPVRHVRDGLTENTRSKSLLISTLHAFLETSSNILYFPSYEIVHEELKDYRFLSHDLMHPSEWTINYIFRRFVETYGTKDLQTFLQEASEMNSMRLHKVKSTNPQEIQKWNNHVELKLTEFKRRYPNQPFNSLL